jgi:pilus assembly protein Flp/PilA
MFEFSMLKALVDMLRYRDEEAEGQGLVEYALILVLISVVAIGVMTTMGTKVSGVFSSINGHL